VGYNVRAVHQKSTDVSEEHDASIFRVEECVNQETSMKQLVSRACAAETSVDFKWTA
jgi:hypothetical protein